MTISEAVREVRQVSKMTQEQFARYLGLTLRTVARYENEVPPSGIVLFRLLDIAGSHHRDDLVQLFQDGIERELSEQGVSRSAFKGFLRSHFMNILENLEETLKIVPTTAKEAHEILEKVEYDINLPQFLMLKQMIDVLDNIRILAGSLVPGPTSITTVTEIKDLVAKARQLIDKPAFLRLGKFPED